MNATRLDHAGPALVVLVLVSAGCLASWFLIGPILLGPTNPGYDIEWMVAIYSTLPRLATALLAGAALSLSGALFQQVLRTPLALGAGRDIVALIGSVIAAVIVVGFGARRGFSPFSLVLAGLVLSLWCGGLSAILIYLNQRYLASLFIWGAGSLAQQSWAVPLSLSWKLSIFAIVSALAVRPLSLLDLGESNSTALGLSVGKLRILVVGCAVGIAALVTSAVGVIGFIGLVAPTLARLAGARRPIQLILWSPLIGAGLLFLADSLLQLVAGGVGEFLPTGAVTAIFGSPLLLALLPRLKVQHRIEHAAPQRKLIHLNAGVPLAVACLAVVTLLSASLFFGRGPGGEWMIVNGEYLQEILALRIPKIFAALGAGAMLAVSGLILQRLTGNEMASPEVLGMSAGATFGVAIGLFVMSPGFSGQFLFAASGSFCVLAIILATSRQSSFAPERVLLAGIALSAMVDALVGILSSTGDPRAALLMRWMSGSTHLVDGTTASVQVALAAVLIAATIAARRWLAILPLGPTASSALGLPLAKSRLALFGLAGVMTAAATLTVGPLSFVGLMGPHFAREAGVTRPVPQTICAALIGGGLMVAADFVGRNIVAPYQIPAGLVSALIGAPCLLLLLSRRH
jgi:iron complex transport system permease protein